MRDAEQRPGLAAEMGRYLGAGMTWALSTLVFLWLGVKVDGWLGTRPVATLAGAFVGAGAGLYWMIRHLQSGDATRKRGGEGEA